MKIIHYFTISLAAVAGLLSASAEKIDVSGAPVKPADNEIWFKVDGIDYSAIKGESTCTVRDAGYDLFQAESGSYSGNVTIPSSVTEDDITYTVTSINAFNYCWNLETLSLPNTIRKISGIRYLPLLSSLEIPEGVETIDGCSSLIGLLTLSLPSNPINLDNAFTNLPNLKKVTTKCTTPYALGKFTFAECTLSDCTLVVPENAKVEYENANGWKDFGAILDVNDPSSVNATVAETPATRITSGGLTIEGYRGAVTVSTPDGTTIATSRVNGQKFLPLQPGIYLITLDNGITRKIRIA